MKPAILILKVFLIILFSWIFSYFTPWWFFAVIAFAAGIIARKSGFTTFISGFLGSGGYYFLFAFIAGSGDSFVFADKIGSVMSAGLSSSLSGYSLLWIGSGIYALIGGLASLSGALILSEEPRIRLQDKRKTKTKRLKLDL